MARPEHLALLDPYLAAIRAHDVDALRSMRTTGYEELFPQSGERVVGPDRAAEIDRTFPAPPTFGDPTHITSLGPDAVAVEVPVRYGEEQWWFVGRLDLEGDRVAREVGYFAAPFEPRPYRAAWVEPFDPFAVSLDRSEPGRSDEIDREDIDRLAGVFEFGRFADISPFLTADWTGEYPQSGERFPNLEALRLAHEPYPGGLPVEHVLVVAGPEERVEMTPFAPVHIHGTGACWMIEIDNTYPDGARLFQVIVLRAKAGRVHTTRWYWCERFEVPDWRRGLTEPITRFD